jgi:signal transduction histidine kinase
VIQRGADESLEFLERYETAVKWVGSMLEIDFASAVSFLKNFRGIFDRLSQHFDRIVAAKVADAGARTDRATSATNRTVLWFGVLTVAAALTIAGFAWLAGRYQRRLRFDAEALENQVAARTRELAARSGDLEDSLARLQETQAKLVMQEKMASLGGLVAGVAHEINTPIGIALISATMLAEEVGGIRTRFEGATLRKSDFTLFLERAAEATDLLLANIERAANLVHSFKAVAVDRTTDERRRFDLKTYLDEVLVSLGPVYKKAGHRVVLSCPDGIAMEGYPGALSQIISNFVTNSVIHAYDPGQKGQLSITVSAPDTQTVELVYADDGKGIPAESLSQVFDPFYTTRRGRGGSGLGMHIVYNLVTARWGGDIRLDSEEGRGARFTLSLPRLPPVAAAL